MTDRGVCYVLCAMCYVLYARCSDCENRLRVREFLEEGCVVSVEGKVREMGEWGEL